jgi:two-component system invasion response regulator UvrY
LRVLIADDHAIVRAGLRQILAEADGTATVYEARDGLEAEAMALSAEWDVVVLDITMPGASGLQVLRTVSRAKPALPVLVLSMHANPAYVRGALRAGAAGYVTKDTAPEELLTALRAILAGEQYVSPSISL